MSARFEIVQTDDGWTARFRSGNGAIIFSTGSQVYTRRRGAVRAIELLRDGFAFGGPSVVDVDERSQS